MEKNTVFELFDEELIRSAREEADNIIVLHSNWKAQTKTAIKQPKSISSYTNKDWFNLNAAVIKKELKKVWKGMNSRCN